MNALIECRGGLHRHSGPGRLLDRESVRSGLHLGSGDRQVVLGPEIPAVADLDRRHRRSHDHAGVAKVLSAPELFLADYSFLEEILLLYQCMGVGEHIIRCIHHLNTI